MYKVLILCLKVPGCGKKPYPRERTYFAYKRLTFCKVKLLHVKLLHATKKVQSIMIIIRNSDSFQLQHLDADGIILEGIFDNTPLVIDNLYAPNTHHKKFFKQTMSKLSHYPRENLMM